MSRDTDKNLFIVPSMPRFYQQLLSGVESYRELGNRIIRQIKAAHAFRQVERVSELARVLINIPVKEYQLIAQYYLVWCQCRESKYDTVALEKIAEQTQTYKAKALISIAAFEIYKSHMSEALHFYTEALRTNPTLPDYIKASTGIATVKSIEGFHKSALTDLENLLPLLRYAEPLNYFEVANSYAVELGKAGRKDEARNVIKRVLASPFAPAYPESQETARELKEPDRPFISVPRIEHKPVEVEIKETPHAGTEAKPIKPGRVVPFPELKEAPKPKKPDRLTPQEHARLTESDKRELILAAIRSGAITGDDYDKLMGMVGLLTLGPADKVLDLEDEEILDDIAVIWSAAIGNEEFAGFLSALRDCDDSLRQKNILDRLITKIFHESPLCTLTEDKWRLKVERRLPKK